MPVLVPPIGTIVSFAGPIDDAWETANGWMICNGRSLDRKKDNSKFQPLFDAIGSSWGGDGVNKFNLPDLQGMFLRGVNGTSQNDPDVDARYESRPGGHVKGDVGSIQDDAIQSHTHTDKGHDHTARTKISGSLPRWFEESCERGTDCGVNGNEGNQGNFDPQFTGSTIIEKGFADVGEPVALSGGKVVYGKETRPINAYVYWIIRWK